MDEALRRATAYLEAGADAILMHSKQSTPDQILEFLHEWGGAGPVVIVPTMYHQTPTELIEDAGASWANHLLRARIGVMQDTAAIIWRDRSLHGVEGRVVPVKEVFRLQSDDELKAAEERYLPSRP